MNVNITIMIGMTISLCMYLYITYYNRIMLSIKLKTIQKFRRKWELAEIIMEWNDGDSFSREIRESKMSINNLLTSNINYVDVLGIESVKLLGLDSDDHLNKLVCDTFETIKIVESKVSPPFSMINIIQNQYKDVLKMLK